MSTIETSQEKRQVWLFTFACIGFMMVIWLMDACLAALLPEIEQFYRGVGVVQGAQLVTTYNVGYMIASLIFGPLGDVLNRFRLIIIAATLFLITGILFALLRNFPAALLLRFGGGFFGGMLTVNIWSGLIHEVPKSHFNTAIGLLAGTRAYSVVLGLPLVMNMVDWIGWTPTFLILGIAISLPLIAFMITSKRPGPSQKHGSLNPIKHYLETLKLPGIATSLAGFFCVRVAGSAPFVFLSLWLFEVYAFDTSLRASLLSIYGVGEILGSWGSVSVINHLGARRTFLLGIVGVFILLSILVYNTLPVWVIGSCLLVLSIFDRCHAMAFWRIYMPQDRIRTGTLSSMGNIAFAGSIALVTGVGAVIAQTVGWKLAAIIILALLVVGAFILRFSLFVPERLAKAEDGW